MGKLSPVSAKYIIHTSIQIEGAVERPDVIGAIFGQTEGLLGSELELRELQRSGKIGRIEVKIDITNGKSTGNILIPSSLDKAETAIIAASLETIDRIGPCNSKVRVEKLEDVRISKREFVISRAKELLKSFQSEIMPDSQEITDEVSQSVRMMEIMAWGPEKLPAGPSISDSEEIIFVEGRADVLNLLKYGMKNCVAMNGTSVPESLKNLSKQKVITVFVDGDRGGDLILKELLETSDIDYITKAPDGKELEELTKKEIHIALRGKIAAAQYRADPLLKRPLSNGFKRPSPRITKEPRQVFQQKRIDLSKKDKTTLKEMLDDIVGTRGACLLDNNLQILGKVPTAELIATLNELKDIHAVVFDGILNKEVVKAGEKSNVNYILATNIKINPNETKVNILGIRDLT
ncbi:MAG TPA: DNA primase DnaG [Candidatus Nanoarchaeia archaeon]|nr:DNA primase DnaG [Candidatus Nanoarchaeia archaeon]